MIMNELVNIITKLILFKPEKGIPKLEWYSLGILFYLILLRILFFIFF